MSIEYTIDIQLTELGFPDILQPQGTSSADPLSPRRSHASLSKKHKEKLLLKRQQTNAEVPQVDATKQAAHVQQTPVVSVSSPCDPVQAAQSVEDDDKEAVGDVATAGGEEEEAVVPPQSTDQQDEGADDGQQVKEDSPEGTLEVDDDSEDSDVSVGYEEEEEEGDDDEDVQEEEDECGDHHCSVCGLHLSSSFKLQEHMNLHTGARPHCCAECGKRFCQMYNYRLHLRKHAQTKVDQLMCRVCLRRFLTEEDLKLHQSSTHFEDTFYECDLCKLVFTSLAACENHVQFHKSVADIICELCGRNFSSPKSLARHRSKICNRVFQCTDCTMTFSKINALLKHSFSHLGLLPYTCVRCRCHFRLAKLYRQHKCEPQRIHCVACLREFLSQEDFQQHKKDTGCWGQQESKKDEIRCLECGKCFDTTEEFKKHAGAHQRVLKCAECGKGFRSALLLMSHMGGHAGQSPCLCQRCGLGFPHQQSYDSHLKTCGTTRPPVSAPKKQKPSKVRKPEAIVPTDKPAAQVEASASPGLVAKGVPPESGSGSGEGMWKLTLQKQPPPGVSLVLFVTAGSALANGLSFPQAAPHPDSQVQPQVAPPPVSSEKHGMNGNGLQAGSSTQGPDHTSPLDLSNRSTDVQSSLPHLPIKSEPEELQISVETHGVKRHVTHSSEKRAGDTNTEVKRVKSDPPVLSNLSVGPISSGVEMDIKKEPQSPCSEGHSWPSSSYQDKPIKMEEDRAQGR
ncbi:uncharacterized protein LOC143008897 [Genypterus blacodes]|uniref:uncharacterized protein LOC143008897 n=1 Tax=Genypterus blacodes TaxID=154954 RepID=UPI003F777CA8